MNLRLPSSGTASGGSAGGRCSTSDSASAPDSSSTALGSGFHSRPFHHQRPSALIRRIASSAYYGGLETQPRSCSVVAMTELSPEEILEVEADRRRRVSAALRLGSQPSEAAARPVGAGALAAGTAIAIALALALGVIAIAQGTGGLGGGGRAPAPAGSPSTSRWPAQV